MKKIFWLICMAFVLPSSNGQTVVKIIYGQQYETALLKSLSEKKDDISRIEIYLKIIDYHLDQREYQKSNLDSAAIFLKEAKLLDSLKANRQFYGRILFDESKLARKAGSLDSSRQFADQAIKILRANGDTIHLIQTYLQLSRCYDSNIPEQKVVIKNIFDRAFELVPRVISSEINEKYTLEFRDFYHIGMNSFNTEEKLDFIERLTHVYKTHEHKIEAFWARKEMADLHYHQGKLNEAISELLLIAQEQKAGDFPDICFTYDLLSGLYLVSNNHSKALYYALETIKNVKTGGDSVYLSNFYSRVASSYSLSGSVDQAIEWNMKRLNYMISTKQTNSTFSVLFNVISDMLKLGRKKEALKLILEYSQKYTPVGNGEKKNMLISIAKCYESVEDYSMAEIYYEKLIKHVEEQIKHNEIKSDMNTNQYLASFYLKIKQYDKAYKYFTNYVKDWGSTRKEAANLFYDRFLFQYDSAKGNYVSAIRHLQMAHHASDSIYTEAKSKQIEELKVTYATEQKDSLIALNGRNIQLLQQQDELQKSKLRQGVILRNISFALGALLIIIVALLFNRYRLKQKTNRRLELQQNEISKQNNSLQHLVTEKDWLLKEIHHRVKNNLQIVMSLLNSQSAFIDNETALTAIHDSQHRVHAMSLIHQKLYNTENLSSIDMSVYIRELGAYLRDSFDIGQRIRFEFNIQPIEMDVSQAVPLGLILNEAITNSLKYAFPDNRNGKVSISLLKTNADQYLLSVSDNGIGIPATIKKTGSLGMSLMKGLSEDLDGNFSIENNNGTTINISFIYGPGITRSNIVSESFVSHN